MVNTTVLKGIKVVMISGFILKDVNGRAFQRTVVCNSISQYETCHTPDVIIGTNFIISPYDETYSLLCCGKNKNFRNKLI